MLDIQSFRYVPGRQNPCIAVRINLKMINLNKKLTSADDPDKERLDGLFSVDVLTLDLVSALAGDRPLTKAEVQMIDNKKNSLGNKFYSDMLYAITHQHFEAEIANTLWQEILRHKYEMSTELKRNIRVVVAALDYLSNITGDIQSPTLISEDHIADIIDVSLRDGLTGLFNHAFFYRRLEFELERPDRYNTPVSLMMIDIDDFKKFNDHFGHQEGDAVLRTVGAIIEAVSRDSDVCCRYGGEELCVILPSTDTNEAILLAEKLRKAIEKSQHDSRKITVSIGVAAADRELFHTPQSLVKKADDALYEAKANGKNCIVVWE